MSLDDAIAVLVPVCVDLKARHDRGEVLYVHPVVQSSCLLHVLPTTHFGAPVRTPPQSTSLSSAFWTPSVDVGFAHFFDAGSHTLLVQSVPALQPLSSAQRGAPVAAGPPQSMSVSCPFITPSSIRAG
ncbi:hypothetical protein [Salmonella enterica]|nr:hypothetical protein [Salmonella enterica]